MSWLRPLNLSLALVAAAGAMTLAPRPAESRPDGVQARRQAQSYGAAVSGLKRHLERQRNVDLKKVRVVCEYSDRSSLVLSLRHRARNIGMMEIMTKRDRPAYVNGVFISDDSFRGKGLGSLLYMVAAKATRDKLGCDLGGYLDQTQDARRLWGRFKAQGLVYPIRPSARPYAFKPQFVQSDALKELFRQHYRDDSRPRTTTLTTRPNSRERSNR